MLQRGIKRTADILGAAAVLLLLSPVLLSASAAIAVTTGRPVIFRQRRAGLHGAIFDIYKLRTMTDERDSQGRLLPPSLRLTRVGRVLRRLSIDELPQLWNVLKGDMSLIGPRPLFAAYLPRYNRFQMQRHNVRPGITGWAQISGRDAVTWDQKFELDVWYVTHWTLLLDLKIALATVWIVLTGKGNVEAGGTADCEFAGTPEH